MDYNSSSEILSAVIVFLAVILSLFLFTVPSENKKSNRFLAGFLLLIAIDISVFLYDQLINLPLALEMLRIRLSAFKTPFLYLYILAVIYSDFRLKPKHLIHTLPFLIPVFVLIPRFFLTEPESQAIFMQNYGTMPEIHFIRIFETVVTGIYLLKMALTLKRFRKVSLQNSSSQSCQWTCKWLSQFVAVIILLWTITLVKEMLKIKADLELLNSFRTMVLILGVGFITWLTLKALHAPHLFRGLEYENKTVDELIKEKRSSPPSAEDPVKNQVKTLRNFMLTEEPYLNPSLSVKDLATQINLPDRELSLLINKEIGQHFFDFINEYRILKAKKLLADPQMGNSSIQEILFAVGFNSKTPFNTAFKKHTGMTPSEFKKSLKNSGL